MHNIDHSVQDILKVPITDLDEDTIGFGCIYWECKPPIGFFFGGLPKEVREFKDILKQMIFMVRLEDTTPTECKRICTWYEKIRRADTYFIIEGQTPRIRLHPSLLIDE